MRRLLLITAFATSLLGCIGTGVLRIRSYWVADCLTYHETPAVDSEVTSDVGVLEYRRVPSALRCFGQPNVGGKVEIHSGPASTIMRLDPPTWLGSFKWKVWTDNWSPAAWAIVAVPHSLLLAMFGIGAIWPLARLRKLNRRQRQGCCVNCGYDLRASPERCPECGRPREDLDTTADEPSAATADRGSQM